MPNSNYTEARRHLKTYISILKEAEKGNTTEDMYDGLLDSMESLSEYTKELYISDYGQKEKPLTEKELKDTLDLYKKCREECERLDSIEPKTKLDYVRKNIGEYLKNIIGKDMVVLVDAKPGQTISEIVTRARTKHVYLDNQELTKTSGQMSSRIPITIKNDDGTERKGFFTESTYVGYTDRYFSLLKRMREKHPKFAPLIDAMIDVKKLEYALDSMGSTESTLNMFFENTMKDFGVDSELLGEFPNDEKENSDFYIELFDELKVVATDRQMYANPNSWIGTTEGANIDKRNSAMTSMAALLGVPDLIAHSENMKLSVNGKEITGTFMENAAGKEAYRLSKDDPMRKYGAEVYETQPVIKQLADMQVLDYICGNIDRHEGNFFIQFDTSDPEHPKATGIKGIDNDMSFMARTGEGERKIGNIFIRPEEMTVVSKSMADTLMQLDEGVMRVNLAHYGLSLKEVDAAVERLNILKKAINKDLEYFNDKEPGYFEKGRIRVVPDEEMGKLKFEQLYKFADGANRFGKKIYTSLNNQFYVFSNMPERIRRAELDKADAEKSRQAFEESRGYHVLKEEAPAKKTVAIGKTSVSVKETKRDFENKLPKLKKLYANLDKADRWFTRSSQNFKDMKQSLKDLISETGNMPAEYSFKDYKKLRDLTLKLAKDTEKYHDEKLKEGELSSRAKKRVDAAKEISGGLEDMLDLINTTDKNYEKQVNAIVAMTLFNEGYPASTAIEMQPYNSELTDRAREILYESMADPKCTKLKDIISEFQPAFATYSHTPEYQKELDSISSNTKDALSKLIDDEIELISSVEKNELGVIKAEDSKAKEITSADKLTKEVKSVEPEDKKKRDLTVPVSAKKKEDEKEEASIGVDGPK